MKLLKIYCLLLIILCSCVFPLENYLINNARAEVCILYYETKYKNALVNRLGKDLNNERISAYVDTFNNMDKYDPDDYDAVILLSGVLGFNPLPLTAQYLNKHNYKDNIIYFCAFMTSKDAVYGSSIDKNKIDAITAASATTDSVVNKSVKKVSNQIVDEVLRIIE